MISAEEQRLLEVAQRAAELVATYALNELTIEEGGLRVTVRGVADIPAPSVVAVPMHPHLLLDNAQPAYSQTPTGVTPSPVPAAEVPASASLVALESPMVGVFYHSPSPEDPPFVNVGDIIKVGQTVGLIEAMKVYSELPSDVSGRIVRLAAENGALVQQGQPLLYVESV